MRYLLSIFLAATIFMYAHSSNAVDVYPKDVDSRLVIDDINSDTVTIRAPYGFHEQEFQDRQIERVAIWACGLYKRVPVSISAWPTHLKCDEMGRAMAEREWECGHFHQFACAIP